MRLSFIYATLLALTANAAPLSADRRVRDAESNFVQVAAASDVESFTPKNQANIKAQKYNELGAVNLHTNWMLHSKRSWAPSITKSGIKIIMAAMDQNKYKLAKVMTESNNAEGRTAFKTKDIRIDIGVGNQRILQLNSETEQTPLKEAIKEAGKKGTHAKLLTFEVPSKPKDSTEEENSLAAYKAFKDAADK